MQDIIVEKPYEFVPPHRGTGWPWLIQRLRLFDRHLRSQEGVVEYECRHEERLSASLQAGHGILLTPNHCRTADPLVMGFLARETNCNVFAMASWHLFNQDWFTAWAIRKMGGFSVNREGVDRTSINTAIEILTSAERPLILFPEGAVSRTNDQLHALLDGVAFIARSAAKKRQRKVEGGKVVVHPVAIKYLYGGDILKAIDDVLTDIEQRFSWKPQRHLSIQDRVTKVGNGILVLKELEYFGEPQQGDITERQKRLIDRLLGPIEEEFLGGIKDGMTVPRVKAVRMQILPPMIQGEVDEAERQRRWGLLADIYLAQQVSCYPQQYLEFPTVDRYLETIERFEEDLTDKARVHGQLKAVIEVGEAIEVSPQRDRAAKVDPLMQQIQLTLESMIAELAKESPLVEADG